jgi:hypothetical protein
LSVDRPPCDENHSVATLKMRIWLSSRGKNRGPFEQLARYVCVTDVKQFYRSSDSPGSAGDFHPVRRPFHHGLIRRSLPKQISLVSRAARNGRMMFVAPLDPGCGKSEKQLEGPIFRNQRRYVKSLKQEGSTRISSR